MWNKVLWVQQGTDHVEQSVVGATRYNALCMWGKHCLLEPTDICKKRLKYTLQAGNVR